MSMTELEWLIRDYCTILWDIQKGDMDAEDSRQAKHIEIADFLKCDREAISPVLHNIDYTQGNGFNFLRTAKTLRQLKAENLI